jgi:hypothetical protein
VYDKESRIKGENKFGTIDDAVYQSQQLNENAGSIVDFEQSFKPRNSNLASGR